jgi:hypothetical protein
MCFVKGLRLRKTEKWARKSDGRGAIWESGIIWSYEKLKLARRCGCTPLWREAHFQIKTYKKLCSEHFWKLRCWSWKNARGCGAKHISKSKCAKHTIARALLEVYTSLWREADVEVNMSKNTAGSERFWRLRCRKSAHHCGAKHVAKSKRKNTPCLKHFWKLRRWKREANLEVKMRTEPNVWTIEKRLWCRKKFTPL